MRFVKTASNLIQPNGAAIVHRYSQDSQLTVNLVLVSVPGAAPLLGGTYSYLLTNRSAGANIIRVGLAPSFVAGAVSGISILPGESISLDCLAFELFAISNIAGALLDRLVTIP